MSADRPYPGDVVPDTADKEFWDACLEGRFLIFRCNVCGRTLWPAGGCPDHGLIDSAWVESAGTGKLHTWTVVHNRYTRSFVDEPAVIGVVELDDGPLMHCTLLGTTAEDRVIGLRVQVSFEQVAEGVTLPVFRPSSS